MDKHSHTDEAQTATPEDRLDALRALYPSLTEGELREAEETLQQYARLAWRIYERIASDPAEAARLRALTVQAQDPIIEDKRSNSYNDDHPRET